MLKTLGLAFAVLAGLLLLVGAGFAAWTLVFLNRSEVTAGTVIRLDDEGLADRRSLARMTRPVIRFATKAGASVEFALSVASSPPAYAIGEPVMVRYDPAAPTTAKVDSWFDLWSIPTLIAGLGGIFGMVATILVALHGGHARSRADLVAHGARQPGRVVAVERSYFTKGGDGRALRNVIVDGAARRFKVGGFRAGDVDHLQPGDAVTIIVDTRDPANFALDLPETNR